MKSKKQLFAVLVIAFIGSCFAQNSGVFTDSRDEQVYRWVRIGNQIWMAENLNYSVRRGSARWGNNYGLMYNWKTAKKVAPPGWHLPSDEEWQELELTLGISQSEINKTYSGDRSSGNVGYHLKSRSGWQFYMQAGNGDDKYGFTALPGGYSHGHTGRFMYYGTAIYFWTSTAIDNQNAHARALESNFNGIGRDNMQKEHGCYIRCVKD